MSPVVRELAESVREDLSRTFQSFKLWFAGMLVVHAAALVAIIKWL